MPLITHTIYYHIRQVLLADRYCISEYAGNKKEEAKLDVKIISDHSSDRMLHASVCLLSHLIVFFFIRTQKNHSFVRLSVRESVDLRSGTSYTKNFFLLIF